LKEDRQQSGQEKKDKRTVKEHALSRRCAKPDFLVFEGKRNLPIILKPVYTKKLYQKLCKEL
jgi:hypothetical protein